MDRNLKGRQQWGDLGTGEIWGQYIYLTKVVRIRPDCGYVLNDPLNAVDPWGLISCNNARYNGISDCIDKYDHDIEACKCNGGNEETCKLKAKLQYENCIKQSHGRCNEDLNGDGKVDKYDDLLWFFMRRLYDLRTPPGSPYPPGYGNDGPGSIDKPPVPPQT